MMNTPQPTIREVAAAVEAENIARLDQEIATAKVEKTSQARSNLLMKFSVGTIIDLGNDTAIRVTSGYGSYEQVTILK